MKRLLAFCCFYFLAFSIQAATPADPVSDILNSRTSPPGVVFEVVAKDPKALDWALPQIRRDAKRLRTRFPGLPIAVVTHGNEQFALLKRAQGRQEGVHDLAKALRYEDHIPVHACGAYASHKGVDASEFADYVDVVPMGPAQIRTYEDMGYLRVRVQKRES